MTKCDIYSKIQRLLQIATVQSFTNPSRPNPGWREKNKVKFLF